MTSADYSRFLDHTGHATSYLRPAVVATVDGERLDVLTRATSFKRAPRFASAGRRRPYLRAVSPRGEVRATDGRYRCLQRGGIVRSSSGSWPPCTTLCWGCDPHDRGRSSTSSSPIVRMRLMGIQPSVIVTNLVRRRKAGLALTVDEMQSHYWRAAASRR